MRRQTINVKAVAVERVDGSLVVRVADTDALETALVFGPALAGHLPQLIIGAPERPSIGPTQGTVENAK